MIFEEKRSGLSVKLSFHEVLLPIRTKVSHGCDSIAKVVGG